MNSNRTRPITYLDKIANMDLPTRPSASHNESIETHPKIGSMLNIKKINKYILLTSWVVLFSAMFYFSYAESVSNDKYLPLTKQQRSTLSETWYQNQALSLDIGLEVDINDRLTLSKPLKKLMAKGVNLDCLRVIDVAHYQLDLYRVSGTATLTSPADKKMFSVGIMSYYTLNNGVFDHRYTNIVFPGGDLNKIIAKQDHNVIENTKVSEYRVDGKCTALPSSERAKNNDNAFFSKDKPEGFLFYRHLVNFFSYFRSLHD